MTLAAKVMELAEKYRDQTAENLARLVRIKSLSGEEEAVNAAVAPSLRGGL